MARHALLKVLLMPDPDRTALIGEIRSPLEASAATEPLIDREEDRTLRAVLVGMLREGQRDLG